MTLAETSSLPAVSAQTALSNVLSTQTEKATDSGPDNSPLFFSRADLDIDDFDAVSFVADRKHVPFDGLQRDLLALRRSVKSEIVECITVDYSRFINLATNLIGVDDMISDLAAPLEGFARDAESLSTHYTSALRDLDAKLRAQADIREQKVC